MNSSNIYRRGLLRVLVVLFDTLIVDYKKRIVPMWAENKFIKNVLLVGSVAIAMGTTPAVS